MAALPKPCTCGKCFVVRPLDANATPSSLGSAESVTYLRPALTTPKSATSYSTRVLNFCADYVALPSDEEVFLRTSFDYLRKAAWVSQIYAVAASTTKRLVRRLVRDACREMRLTKGSAAFAPNIKDFASAKIPLIHFDCNLATNKDGPRMLWEHTHFMGAGASPCDAYDMPMTDDNAGVVLDGVLGRQAGDTRPFHVCHRVVAVFPPLSDPVMMAFMTCVQGFTATGHWPVGYLHVRPCRFEDKGDRTLVHFMVQVLPFNMGFTREAVEAVVAGEPMVEHAGFLTFNGFTPDYPPPEFPLGAAGGLFWWLPAEDAMEDAELSEDTDDDASTVGAEADLGLPAPQVDTLDARFAAAADAYKKANRKLHATMGRLSLAVHGLRSLEEEATE